jgi:hypothetical protein
VLFLHKNIYFIFNFSIFKNIMTFSENPLTVYFESPDLLNSFKDSFSRLKVHIDFDINFVLFDHSQDFVIPDDSISIFFTNKLDKYITYVKGQNYPLLAFANHIEFCKLYENINNLGFQRQLCEINDIHSMEAKSDFNYSLGLLLAKEDLVNVELRNTQHALVDLSILSKSSYNFSFDSLLTGISLEKLIQLIANCSKSPKMKSLFFNTGNLNFENLQNLSELFSTILWYFIEGIKSGVIDFQEDKACDKFITTIKELDHDLEFIHQNGYYWVKLVKETEQCHPCAFEEYQEGMLGELSARLFKKLF